MNYGFVKAAAAVPEVRVGDCDFNSRQMQDLLFRAAKEQAEIVVFPELAVTGYTCADLFRQRLLLDKAEEALAELVAATAKLPLLCAVGLPVRAENALYNCAVVFQKGKILGAVPKTFLPNYAEFYEKRWFRSGAQVSADRIWLAGQEVPFGTDLLFACGDAVVGVEICEDLWVPVPPLLSAGFGGREHYFKSFRQPRSRRQTRLFKVFNLPAVGALLRRLCVCFGGVWRIVHGFGVCRKRIYR